MRFREHGAGRRGDDQWETALAIGLVSSALSGVYAAAVYRYAAEGQTGAFFTPALVKGAFRRK